MVSEITKFQFSFANDLRPRSNDIDLEYSHTFIDLISCLHLPNFRSQAEKVSKNSILFLFDIVVKWVKINLGSLFEQTMIGWSPQCYIPSFADIGSLFLEKILEVFFTIDGRGGHLAHVTQMLQTNFRPPHPWNKIWPSGLGDV